MSPPDGTAREFDLTTTWPEKCLVCVSTGLPTTRSASIGCARIRTSFFPLFPARLKPSSRRSVTSYASRSSIHLNGTVKSRRHAIGNSIGKRSAVRRRIEGRVRPNEKAKRRFASTRSQWDTRYAVLAQRVGQRNGMHMHRVPRLFAMEIRCNLMRDF